METVIFLLLFVMTSADTPKSNSLLRGIYNESTVLSERSALTLTPESGEGLSESERILVIALLVVLSLTNVILIICVVITCKKNAIERNSTKTKTLYKQPRELGDSDGVRLSKTKLNSRYHETRQLPITYELQEYPADGHTTDTEHSYGQKPNHNKTPKHVPQSPSGQQSNPRLLRSISMDPRVSSFQTNGSPHAVNRQVSFSSLPGNMPADDTIGVEEKKYVWEDMKGYHPGPKQPLGRINSAGNGISTKSVPPLHRDVYL